MSEIEERKKELSFAVKKLQDSEQQLSNLQAKKSELSYSNNDRGGIDAAITHRREVMALLVTGRASQVELDEATMRVDELGKAAKLSDEMAEAITGAIQAAEKDISQLKTAIDMAKRRLYEAIYDKLKQEIQEIISDRVSRAVAIRAVAIRSKPEQEYGVATTATMNDIFSEIAAALEKEFKLNQR